MRQGALGVKRKLLFVVTEDWYFVSHRLGLAVDALRKGYEVGVVTKINHDRELIESNGIKVFPIDFCRGRMNPLCEIRVFVELARYVRCERPDIIHHVGLKPVIYGGLVSSIAKVSLVINAVSGLGSVFSEGRGWIVRLRRLMRATLKYTLRSDNASVIVQNADDRDALIAWNVVASDKIDLVAGAGVDVERFCVRDEAAGLPRIVLASRMLWEKGIADFVGAAKLLRDRGEKARFILVGESDRGSYAGIADEQLAGWVEAGVVEWLGRRADMPEILGGAAIVCLPSYYGEGIPKVLLEAAACGKPIVTTDMPGCREVVKHGVNGLLVQVRAPQELADALQKLLDDKGRRVRMGLEGRRLAEEKFSARLINSRVLDIIERRYPS